jgi:hypothetical protein
MKRIAGSPAATRFALTLLSEIVEFSSPAAPGVTITGV